MTRHTRAQNLLGLLCDLIAILEKENRLLERPDPEQLTLLVEEKQSLFFEYDKQLAALNNDMNFAESLTKEAKAELKELSLRFDAISRENEDKLRAALKTSDMVVAHIARAASNANGASLGSYGGDGHEYKTGKRAAPIAVNRML